MKDKIPCHHQRDTNGSIQYSFDTDLDSIIHSWPICHEPRRGGYHSFTQWGGEGEDGLSEWNRDNEESIHFMNEEKVQLINTDINVG